MAWLKIDQNLPRHPKTIRLAHLRRHRNTDETSGFLQRLWGWALDAKPDGMVGEVEPDTLGSALRVRDGDVLLEQLRTTGFVCTPACAARGLDPVAHRPGRIHDWDEMSGELARQRAQDAERKRLVRAHDREQHANDPVNGCPRCERSAGQVRRASTMSAGRPPDRSSPRPANGASPAPAPAGSSSMSAGRPPDATTPTEARPPDASRARAREGDKRETRQESPDPRSVDRTGPEEVGRQVLEEAEPRWRAVLESLLAEGGATMHGVATFFRGSRLVGRDTVVVANGFVRDHLEDRWKAAVARELGVPTVRFVLERDLEPAIPDAKP